MPILWPEVAVHPHRDDDAFTWHVPVTPCGLAGVVYEMEQPPLLSGRLTSHIWYPLSGSAHLQLHVRADETDEVAQALDDFVMSVEESQGPEIVARTSALEKEATEQRAAATNSAADEVAEELAARLRGRGRGSTDA